jgi:hypothetical protein
MPDVVLRIGGDTAGGKVAAEQFLAALRELATGEKEVRDAAATSGTAVVDAHRAGAAEAGKQVGVVGEVAAAYKAEGDAAITAGARQAEGATVAADGQKALRSSILETDAVAAGAGSSILGMFKNAALFGAGFLGFVGLKDSIQTILSAQAGIAKLDTAIRDAHASVKALTPVLDDYADKSRRLGFTDDQTREAEAKLVAAFGATKHALDEVRVAQDLARARNIDLATATRGLILLQEGNTRAAKEFGLALPNLTSAQWAQKAAVDGLNTSQEKGKVLYDELLPRIKGQADAFAATPVGKMQEFHAELQATEEQIGNGLLPAVDKYLTEVDDWLSKSANQKRVTQDVERVVHDLGSALHDAYTFTEDFLDVTSPLAHALGGWKTVLEGIIALKFASTLSGWASAMTGGVIPTLGKLIGGSGGGASAGGLVEAESRSGRLLGNLTSLAKLGSLAIGVDLLIKAHGDKGAKGFLESLFGAGLVGFTFGGPEGALAAAGIDLIIYASTHPQAGSEPVPQTVGTSYGSGRGRVTNSGTPVYDYGAPANPYALLPKDERAGAREAHQGITDVYYDSRNHNYYAIGPDGQPTQITLRQAEELLGMSGTDIRAAPYQPPTHGGTGSHGGAGDFPGNPQRTVALGAGGVSRFAGIDQGVDFTSKGGIPAPVAGTVTDIGTETDVEGQRGNYLILGIGGGRYIYLAENFTPTVRIGQQVVAGERIGINRGITGSGTGIEMGWNAGPKGWRPIAPLPKKGVPTAAGENFAAFLRAHGISAGAPATGGSTYGPSTVPNAGPTPASASATTPGGLAALGVPVSLQNQIAHFADLAKNAQGQQRARYLEDERSALEREESDLRGKLSDPSLTVKQRETIHKTIEKVQSAIRDIATEIAKATVVVGDALLPPKLIADIKDAAAKAKQALANAHAAEHEAGRKQAEGVADDTGNVVAGYYTAAVDALTQERKDLEAELASLRERMRGASVYQRKAIQTEITKVQSALNSVGGAITSALQSAENTLQSQVSTIEGQISSNWGSVQQQILSQFQQQTQDTLAGGTPLELAQQKLAADQKAGADAATLAADQKAISDLEYQAQREQQQEQLQVALDQFGQDLSTGKAKISDLGPLLAKYGLSVDSMEAQSFMFKTNMTNLTSETQDLTKAMAALRDVVDQITGKASGDGSGSSSGGSSGSGGGSSGSPGTPFQAFASGGIVGEPYVDPSDTIIARVSPGEGVVSRAMMRELILAAAGGGHVGAARQLGTPVFVLGTTKMEVAKALERIVTPAQNRRSGFTTYTG